MESTRAPGEEQAFYREIIRRAKRARQRAAESLRRSRESHKRHATAAKHHGKR
jgi:hypothetical protein